MAARLAISLIVIFYCCTALGTSNKFCASFAANQAGGAQGYFAIEISGDGAWAKYKFDVDTTGTSVLADCTLADGIAYHIHTKWIGSDTSSADGSFTGACMNAGPHYDPNFACGPKSQWSGVVCGELSRDSAGYYKCSTEFKNGDYGACEVGDLSGKFGNAIVSDGRIGSGEFLYDPLPPYAHNHNFVGGGTAPGGSWESLVFHCNKPTAAGYRVLCAEFIESTDGDACHAGGGFDKSSSGGSTDDNASQQDACANCECQEKGYEYTQDDLVKFIILSIALTIVVNCICAVVGWFFEKKQKKRKDTVIVQHVAPPPSQRNPVHKL
jgi:hypothetical protein